MWVASTERVDLQELGDWMASFEEVIRRDRGDAAQLLARLRSEATRHGLGPDGATSTPYVNTLHPREQPEYPGDLEIEWQIEAACRWNAVAMVARANRDHPGLGGHLSTYASTATLYEVGFQHFFRGLDDACHGDGVYFQGHASPGIYARAFLEGRLDEAQLVHFRRECERGLSSYPHPWLMPELWARPTVSMGLGPIMAVQEARMHRYLRAQGRIEADRAERRIWCFVGDGECDEPESLAALALAARERLSNLIFVINCNLQRLDGPVRGNSNIVQELERRFASAGWDVFKVLWGSAWDPLFASAAGGELIERIESLTDGDLQRTAAEPDALRELLFSGSKDLEALIDGRSDEDLAALTRGGHDPRKIHAAYAAAVQSERPAVVLAQTVKGHLLGNNIEARNVTHQQKKLSPDDLAEFRDRLGVPLSESDARDAAFLKFDEGGRPHRYLHERREALGGYLPRRTSRVRPLEAPAPSAFARFERGSGDDEVATTMVMVKLLGQILRDETIGQTVVPIVPDEARTFGMDALFRKIGIYAPGGQHYEPVDKDSLLYYRESKSGRLLEEGISEASAMAAFIAAGTAATREGAHAVPFYFFYSMFGFQRSGDLMWAAADARASGFLLGATAGRTTLNGEGLQHQDGHSHVLAATNPRVRAYDPAYAYEIAAIVQHGLVRMLQREEPELFYLTLYNEGYAQPEAPADAREGILSGMYRVRSTSGDDQRGRPQLLGSGPILREVLKAQTWLNEKLNVGADVWSVTSYGELRRGALDATRKRRMHPANDKRPPDHQSYLERVTSHLEGPFIAATDYQRLVVDQITPWLPGRVVALGTDGFGRSDTRSALRDHFEVDARHVAYATVVALVAEGKLDAEVALEVQRSLGIDPDKTDPMVA